MATNPMFQAGTGANGATAPTNPVNNPDKPLKRRYNRFPMSHKVLNTLRYGDITPFLAFEGVEGDKVPFRSTHEIRSYTLKSPLMSDIKMNKDYFLVPMQSILPNNWAKIYTNPTYGDDVPDDANCVLDIKSFAYDLLSKAKAQTNVETPSATTVERALKYLLLAEAVFSNGSLLASMNIHLSPLVRMRALTTYNNENEDVPEITFDAWFDKWLHKYLNGGFTFSVGTNNSYLVGDITNSSIPSTRKVSLSRALEIMRTNPDFSLGNVNFVEGLDPVFMRFDYVSAVTGVEYNINLSRVIAYQICCAHFYTNDKVDFIYSADLWRQNMLGIYSRIKPQMPMFTYNGVPTLYDVMSGHCLQIMADAIGTTAINNTNLKYVLGFWYNLLTFRQSLRFGDYFTGARPTPLAVGDVNAPVVDNSVSAIDMTKNIMMQRFLNAVNRAGRKFSDYVSEIMDGAPVPESTDPKFLAHQSAHVGGFEVENTAESQGNIVTNLRSSGGDFAFDVSVENPCILLGLCSFDVARVYSRTLTRFALKKSRFDMFNPYMQYIGDQEIKACELDAAQINVPDANYAYTLRNMEYKQSINYASGGFVENLPAWAFICDNGTSGVVEKAGNIDPLYIRSSCAELDRFYASLTGLSLGAYFHFIVKFDNELNPARQMEFAPTIL